MDLGVELDIVSSEKENDDNLSPATAMVANEAFSLGGIISREISGIVEEKGFTSFGIFDTISDARESIMKDVDVVPKYFSFVRIQPFEVGLQYIVEKDDTAPVVGDSFLRFPSNCMVIHTDEILPFRNLSTELIAPLCIKVAKAALITTVEPESFISVLNNLDPRARNLHSRYTGNIEDGGLAFMMRKSDSLMGYRSGSRGDWVEELNEILRNGARNTLPVRIYGADPHRAIGDGRDKDTRVFGLATMHIVGAIPHNPVLSFDATILVYLLDFIRRAKSWWATVERSTLDSQTLSELEQLWLWKVESLSDFQEHWDKFDTSRWQVEPFVAPAVKQKTKTTDMVSQNKPSEHKL